MRSRCQHYSFHAVKLVDILGELRGIAEREGLDADDAALGLLAEAGDGSMRDALSIMDQAIASAPLEDGRPRLDAAQIRELMGTVPNAAFETIFAAVDANGSAEVMTLANNLLDAGNSPAQLARQCVRYLRNCLIAKVAGIGTNGEGADGMGSELLQISADEQRRAGRTAALFTEEELTRFLQMMLRTFDELGHRQEQRFHFELGLLKLVHLRRLLPVEELLSRFPADTASAGSSGAGRPGGSGSVAGRSSTSTPSTAPAAVASKPVFSPFEQSRKRFDEPTPQAAVKVAAPVAVAVPATPVAVKVQVMETPKPVAPLSEAVEAAPVVLASVAAEQQEADQPATELQKAVVEALQAAGKQQTAADTFDDAEWTIADGELRVQMQVSKAMLPMIVNADAEKNCTCRFA